MGAIYQAEEALRGDELQTDLATAAEQVHALTTASFGVFAATVGSEASTESTIHPAARWNDHVAIDAEDVAVHMEKAAARWEETAGLTDSSAAGA